MKKIAILASGEGSTAAYLMDAINEQNLKAKVVALIVDRECGAMKVVHDRGIPCVKLAPLKGIPFSLWDQKILQFLKALNPDLILLLGFLRQLGPSVAQSYQGKIINTHPSLLPAFGGKGMYGERVYEAVIAQGEKKTGVSIHYVNQNYDEGQIIAQKEISINNGEKAKDLERRVKAIEKGFLVETLIHYFNL